MFFNFVRIIIIYLIGIIRNINSIYVFGIINLFGNIIIDDLINLMFIIFRSMKVRFRLFKMDIFKCLLFYFVYLLMFVF